MIEGWVLLQTWSTASGGFEPNVPSWRAPDTACRRGPVSERCRIGCKVVPGPSTAEVLEATRR